MFIFSKDGETILNSENVKCFQITGEYSYDIYADECFIENYRILDDAKKELNEIIRQIEAGASSYQIR